MALEHCKYWWTLDIALEIIMLKSNRHVQNSIMSPPSYLYPPLRLDFL
jgi:hypothetical protein